MDAARDGANNMIKWLLTIVSTGLLLSLHGCAEKAGPPHPSASATAPEREQSAAAPTHRRDIAWFTGSVEEAFRQARALEKPVFLYWGAEWCPPCHRLKATIFRQSEFIAQSRQFIPVYLDGDTDQAQALGERFGVLGYPTVIVFDPKGKEITRIPGGMELDRYLTILDLSLNSLRPVTELVSAVQDGQSLSDRDWLLLAHYSWSQDPGDALEAGEMHAVLRSLATHCPDSLPSAKRRLQALALSEWVGMEEREPNLADEYQALLQVIMANPVLVEENLPLLTLAGHRILTALYPESRQPAVQAQMLEILETLIDDDELDLLTRTEALTGWAFVRTALLPESASLPPQQKAWLKQRAGLLEEQLDAYQRQSGISDLWYALYQAGLAEDARAMLLTELDISKQPYYFMSGLGYLEKQEGNENRALEWYRKAWETSRGPATRFQWGCNYLMALIELRPDALENIEQDGTKLLEELSQQPDSLHNRTRLRLESLGETLLTWAATAERREVLATLHAALAPVCAATQRASPAARTCREFLTPPAA